MCAHMHTCMHTVCDFEAWLWDRTKTSSERPPRRAKCSAYIDFLHSMSKFSISIFSHAKKLCFTPQHFHMFGCVMLPRQGLLRLLQGCLRVAEDGVVHGGPPCSSWVWLNRGTSGRCDERVLGNEKEPSVRISNKNFGFNYIVAHANIFAAVVHGWKFASCWFFQYIDYGRNTFQFTSRMN